jgi:serine-type D-Ala-D-Ala carboxypeptidase/endopeptidase (penicillin-binding protein 4)
MVPPRRLRRLAAVLLLVPLTAGRGAASEPRPDVGGAAPSTPATAIEDVVNALGFWARQNGGQLSASVVDIAAGTPLAEHDATRAVNPASNMKILTAAVALDVLGPAFTFRTELHGRVVGDRISPLVLRGAGDPSLTTAALWRLAHALGARGIRHVDGLLVDQSLFDEQFVPPGFEQQPNEWASFRAPVSALSLDGNSVTLNVLPQRAGAPALVWFDPLGGITARGSVMTSRAGSPEDVRLTMRSAGTDLFAHVGGTIPEGAARQRFRRRADDPRLLGARAFAELMRREGITVVGDIAQGGEGITEMLTFVESEPLAVLVRALGKQSDNFSAEMLLKVLGATGGNPATSAQGASAILAWLSRERVFSGGVVIRNGSGLFDTNRLSSRTLTDVLRRAYQSPRIGPDFVAHLAVGGVDGTLKSRLRTHRHDHAVRAKSGTLARTVSLSGYVLPPPGGSPVAFSLLVDGVARPLAETRARIDRVIDPLVAHVSSRPRPAAVGPGQR